MTATIEDVAKKKPEPSVEQQAAAELVRLAKEQADSADNGNGYSQPIDICVHGRWTRRPMRSGNGSTQLPAIRYLSHRADHAEPGSGIHQRDRTEDGARRRRDIATFRVLLRVGLDIGHSQIVLSACPPQQPWSLALPRQIDGSLDAPDRPIRITRRTSVRNRMRWRSVTARVSWTRPDLV
jgi:hypothetical protein